VEWHGADPLRPRGSGRSPLRVWPAQRARPAAGDDCPRAGLSGGGRAM